MMLSFFGMARIQMQINSLGFLEQADHLLLFLLQITLELIFGQTIY